MATSAKPTANPVNTVAFREPAVYTAATYDAYVKSLERPDVTCDDIKDSFFGSQHRDTLVTAVDVRSARAYVNMKGEVSFDPVLFPQTDIWWADPGSLAKNYEVADVTVRSGVCAIIGGGGVGKTPIAHALAAAAGQYAVVRYSEPFAGYLTDHNEAAFQLAHALVNQRAVVFDSAKDLFTGGSLMKSGISRDALSMLSNWSIAASNAGCTLFVPINPSTPDEETRRMLIEALRSNVGAVMYGTGGEGWEYSCRTREGGRRVEGSLNVSWIDGKLRLLPAGTVTLGQPPTSTIHAQSVAANPAHRLMLASLQSHA